MTDDHGSPGRGAWQATDRCRAVITRAAEMFGSAGAGAGGIELLGDPDPDDLLDRVRMAAGAAGAAGGKPAQADPVAEVRELSLQRMRAYTQQLTGLAVGLVGELENGVTDTAPMPQWRPAAHHNTVLASRLRDMAQALAARFSQFQRGLQACGEPGGGDEITQMIAIAYGHVRAVATACYRISIDTLGGLTPGWPATATLADAAGGPTASPGPGGIALPPELAPHLAAAGQAWPEVDEGQLVAIAQIWRDFGEQTTQITSTTRAYVHRLWAGRSADTTGGFWDLWLLAEAPVTSVGLAATYGVVLARCLLICVCVTAALKAHLIVQLCLLAAQAGGPAGQDARDTTAQAVA